MGFWSTLGTVAGIGLAPFTGGASLLIPAAIGAATGAMDGGGWKGALVGGALGAIPGVGGAVGKAVGNGVWGKIAQAGLGMGKNAITQGTTANNVAQVAGNVSGGWLAGREAGRKRGADNALLSQKYGGNAYDMALRSALAKNIQDFQVTPPPEIAARMGKISGGLRPSAIGPEGKAAADAMNAQAMRQLLSSGQYTLPDDLNGTALDTVLGTVATAGKAIGGIQNNQQQGTEQGIIQQILAAAKNQPAQPVSTPPLVGKAVLPPEEDPTNPSYQGD